MRSRGFRIANPRRNGHQSLDRDMFHGGDPGERLFNLIRCKPGFRAFGANVHLKQNALPQPIGCGPSIDFSGQFHAVDGMNELKDPYHRPNLSPLELADEMPCDALCLQGVDFGKGFLQPIFTGDLQSSRDGFADAVDRHGFRRSHQPHHALSPTRLELRASD